MAALFALPSDAQLQCGAEYDRIAAKMASSSGEVTDSEISFALDCERAAAGKGKDPGTIAKPQKVLSDKLEPVSVFPGASRSQAAINSRHSRRAASRNDLNQTLLSIFLW